MQVLELHHWLAGRLDVVYSFMLVFARFSAFMALVPGLGGGLQGLMVRMPAVFVLAVAATIGSPLAAMPSDWGVVVVALVTEVLLGAMIGAIPLLIVTGVQTAAQIMSTSMGLGASQLIDPTSGSHTSDLGRLMGDLTIILFLLIGGHHVVVQAVSGMGVLVPGTFRLDMPTVELFVQRTAQIFEIGVMVSAPVIVALLLTQLVMGLISRAVPTVNIFIISFPLTIGIGLLLTVLSLPEVVRYTHRHITTIEPVVAEIVLP